MEKIEYKNIIYFSNINKIGGVESFLYYLAKKYQDNDITILYSTGDINQIQRLKQFVRVRKFNGEKIKCEKAFLNYNFDIISNIDAKEYIYIIHTDYKEQKMFFKPHPKITKYIGVSQIACDSFKEYTGLDCELCYNPILIDKPKKVLNLISATRLTQEKGKDRMVKFAQILEQNNIPYIWTIFTDDTNKIRNPNMVYMKPRLDIVDFIANADFLVQLSDKGEGFGYTPVEALTVGTPVIVTKCPAFLEVGVKDGENGFVLDFDMNNIDIQKIYKSSLKFKYEPKKDAWNKYLAKGESTYKKDFTTVVKIKCIKNYYDLHYNKLITKQDEPYFANKIRAEYLIDLGLIEIIE